MRSASARWIGLLVCVYLLFEWLACSRPLVPDEIWAVTNAELSFADQLNSIHRDIVHPPLFYLVDRLWIQAFGLNESIKLLPILINVPAIVLFVILVQKITPRWRIASALYLSLYLHVFSAVNLVRMYGLCLLLTIAVVLAWDQWKERQTTAGLMLLSALLGLSVMTHYFGILLVAALVLMDGSRRLMTAAVIPVIVFTGWVAYVFPVYRERGLTANLNWVEPSLARAVAIVPFHFLTAVPSGRNPIHTDWWQFLPLREPVILLVAGLHLTLIPALIRKLRDSWMVLLLGLVLIPTALLAVASLVLRTPAFDSRFLLGLLPLYWLLMVKVCEKRALAVVCGVAIIGVVLPLHYDLGAGEELRRDLAGIPAGATVLADFRLGPQSYWELRKRGTFQVGIRPETDYWNRLRVRLVPSTVWILCSSECPESIMHEIGHKPVERRGQYTRLVKPATAQP
jgi:hypothetical protein